ncbi:MAG: inorganic phosphate transporter [bacterium]|nr:inorganic phosphate transporter [bacterium]
MIMAQLAIFVLIALAISDLIVGVSNDAVNFLNSSIGSRVAPRYVIMIIASAGILAGVTFSSGMMEVARKGIFHPQYFTMPELMYVFLAVMLTDIILLDLYNTYGLPTSTTVSIVFELLGAAVAVSLLKLHQAGESLIGVVNYINTAKALAIIFGILLSVVVAFAVGAVVQFVTRVLFTFDYEKRLRRYGALWGGAALASIVYFILIKGSKGASFITPEMLTWIKGNTLLLLGMTFAICAVLLQLMMLVTRINILKLIVLVGTFALAMAFAANDLVNFIGVPLAGMSAYAVAQASEDPSGLLMDALTEPVQSNTAFLLIAGSIMVITLWLSRKARTVTKTEVRLGRQDEGYERFEATGLSRGIVRLVSSLMQNSGQVFPRKMRLWIEGRLDRSHFRPIPTADGDVPSFDLVRASVNLVVASALIALATSLKLPLSTTYVTFMVAMGTSLSDQAWGRDSAVYRVSGVLTVIGGWFFTAMMAFTVSSIFAAIIFFGRTGAMIAILIVAVALIVRSRRVHKTREDEEQAVEVFNLRKIKDSKAALQVTFDHTGLFLQEVSKVLAAGFDGLIKLDHQRTKEARNQQRLLQRWSNIITANIFKVLRLLQWESVENTQHYSHALSSLQEITESLRDLVMRGYVHVGNNHSGLLQDQIVDLERVRKLTTEILDRSAETMLERAQPDLEFITERHESLRAMVHEHDKKQIARIQDNSSKTRLSILFYSIMWDCLKISEQTTLLLKIFNEPLAPSDSKPGSQNPPEEVTSD